MRRCPRRRAKHRSARISSPARLWCRCASAQRPACTVRSGLVARQNQPRSSEIGTSPTHIQTKTKPKIGLVSLSCPAIAASAAMAYAAKISRRPAHRTAGWSTTLVNRGSGTPLTVANEAFARRR